MDFLWNSINIFWTNKNNHWMTHKRTKIHSKNLKILNQDDVISSKSRATFWPSSRYSSCFLPCPVHTWRLQESRTQRHYHQKRNAVRPKWPCGGGVEIVLIWVDTSEVRMTGQPGYRSKGWLVQWVTCIHMSRKWQLLPGFQTHLLATFLLLSRISELIEIHKV